MEYFLSENELFLDKGTKIYIKHIFLA